MVFIVQTKFKLGVLAAYLIYFDNIISNNDINI